MRLSFFSSSSFANKCVSETGAQKFDSYHTNRVLDEHDFLHLNEELTLTQLELLRNELNTAVQRWVVWMLVKTSKSTAANKKSFFKRLQIIVNLNEFEFNEQDMKLSGKCFFSSSLHISFNKFLMRKLISKVE